jgi:hypothetical protein
MIVSSARCGGVIPTLGCEMDVRAAALEGGLRSRLDDERRCSGGGFSPLSMRVAMSGRWGILVLAMLRHWRLLDRVLEALLGDSGRVSVRDVVQRSLRAKARHFGANTGDACGCHDPRGGVIVVTVPTFRAPGENEDSMAALEYVITLLGSSSYNSGTSWSCSIVIGGQV